MMANAAFILMVDYLAVSAIVAVTLGRIGDKLERIASAIEARSDATGTGAAEGESAVPKADAPKGAA